LKLNEVVGGEEDFGRKNLYLYCICTVFVRKEVAVDSLRPAKLRGKKQRDRGVDREVAGRD
jgi:hypothetical protein